jgi:predicted phosphodiesterase
MKSGAALRQQAERVRALDPAINVMFTGHTHVIAIIELTADGRLLDHRERRVALNGKSFYFVNPGSLGHPRTKDRRASYAIYDDAAQTVTIRRVHYDWRRMMSINREHGITIDLRPSYLQYASGLVSSLRGAVELKIGNG